MVFDFNKFKTAEEIIAEIEKLPTKNYLDTYTGVAFQKAKMEFFDKAGKRLDNAASILVLVTDGDPTDPVQADAAAEQLKKAGIKIMPIALGNGVKEENLKKWASDESFSLRLQFKTFASEVSKITNIVCKGNIASPMKLFLSSFTRDSNVRWVLLA